MKKITIALLVLAVAAGCKKTQTPFPDLELQYQSSKGNYSQSFLFNLVGKNMPLAPMATVSGYPVVGGDSETLGFISTLAAPVNAPFAQVTMVHTFSNTELSMDTALWLNNDQEFLNLFNPGPVPIARPGNNFEQGVEFFMLLLPGDTALYTFVSNDTSCHFIITASTWLPIDWSSFYALNGFEPGFNLLVTANFSGRMAHINMPGDTLIVTNGLYQGIFAEH